jgi:S1-C subfamily serine protease
MKRITATMVFALAAAGAAWAQGRDEDRKILSTFESAWQKAAERAASAVVAIRVDREETRAAKAPAMNNPMVDGGVFKKPPDRAVFVCWECDIEESAAGKCGKCEKDLAKTNRSLCSGTILEADGVIATTCFNLGGKPQKIVVFLADGTKHEGKLLGVHAGADLGLVKIEAKDLPALKFADLGKLKTGVNVVALGRAPDGKGLTVNPGIMSAPERNFGYAIQTDAHTNYGNVGGPLVDIEGRLVGVTCKIETKSSGSIGQNSGISFALTNNHLTKILPDLKLGKSTMQTGRPFMGILADTEAVDVEGVKLRDVVKGGGAERAGIKAGDIILEFDGVVLKTFDELRGMIEKKAIGDQFRVKLKRGEEELELTGTLGERPND